MYENIGKKIKGLAFWTFLLESIGAVITGISIIAAFEEDLAWIAILIMFFGPVVAWVSTWLLYGFGELIDKADAIEQNTRKEDVSKITEGKTTAKSTKTSQAKSKIVKTVSEDSDFVDVRCPNCGKELTYSKDVKSAVCPWCDAAIDL